MESYLAVENFPLTLLYTYICYVQKLSPMRDWRSTPVEWLSSTRDLDLDPVSGHMAYRRASLIDLYLHTKFHWNRKNVLWMDGPTDRRTFPPLMLLGRLRGVNLKTGYHYTFAQLPITSPNVDQFTGRFSITFIVKQSWVSHNTLNALIHYVEIFVFKNCCIEKLRKVHCHARLSYSKRLLKRYSSRDVSIIWFTDRKIVYPHWNNPPHYWLCAPLTKKTTVAQKCLCTLSSIPWCC